MLFKSECRILLPFVSLWRTTYYWLSKMLCHQVDFEKPNLYFKVDATVTAFIHNTKSRDAHQNPALDAKMCSLHHSHLLTSFLVDYVWNCDDGE